MFRTSCVALLWATPLIAHAQVMGDGSSRPGRLYTPTVERFQRVLETNVDVEAELRRRLPDEIVLERDARRLRPTIRAMEGLWRVDRIVVDGVEIPAEDRVSLRYFIQDGVIAQSETSEVYDRPNGVRRGSSRPVGRVLRNDPKQEEAQRPWMIYRGEGRMTAYWWDRYGENNDPGNVLNRPSARLVYPAISEVDLAEGQLTVNARGLGLRAILPTQFHVRVQVESNAPRDVLALERTVLLVLRRDAELSTPPLPEAEAMPLPPEGERGERGERRNLIPEPQRVQLGTDRGELRRNVLAPRTGAGSETVRR